VLIVGAGATGLPAWRELYHAGVNVQILEARDRLGGRILTTPKTAHAFDTKGSVVQSLGPPSKRCDFRGGILRS
jgi:monoamine oxidase